MLDLFYHLPETVRQMQTAFRHAAEVHGQVGACGGPLGDGDHQVVVLGVVAQQLELRHDNILAPDAILVIQGDFER